MHESIQGTPKRVEVTIHTQLISGEGGAKDTILSLYHEGVNTKYRYIVA